jgi:uncharacterized membrane protein
LNEEDQLPLKSPVVAGAVGICIMLAMSGIAWFLIPADRAVAVHWGLSGQPDGFAPKALGLFMLPTIMAVCNLIFLLRVKSKQNRENLAKSKTMVYASWYGALALLVFVHALIVIQALGYNVPVARCVAIAVGLLFFSIGKLLVSGKVLRNNSVGIKTPWTSADDPTWEKTNRLGGWIICAMGVSCILSGLASNMYLLLLTILVGITLLLGATWTYSFIAQRNKPK